MFKQETRGFTCVRCTNFANKGNNLVYEHAFWLRREEDQHEDAMFECLGKLDRESTS